MSHSVTITRMTTTTTGSSVFVNSSYIGTIPGLLKLAQLLLGAACVGVVGYYWDQGYTIRYSGQKPELFYLLISVAFLIGTFCLLTSCVISLSTASLISKTVYEVIYHGMGCVLYLAAGLTLLIEVNHQKNNYSRGDFEPYLAAAMLGGLCQSLLVKYGMSAASTMGSAFHGFLTTASACLLTTALLISCYVLSSNSQQLIRQSIFECLFNAVACFLYLSASSYMGVAVNLYLHPENAIISMYSAYPALTAVYYIGVVVGILHGVDAYISYKYHKGYR